MCQKRYQKKDSQTLLKIVGLSILWRMNINIDGAVTLVEHLAKYSEIEIAEQLNLTRHAVYQMIRAQRDVYIKKVSGKWYYLEVCDWMRGGEGRSKTMVPNRRSYLDKKLRPRDPTVTHRRLRLEQTEAAQKAVKRKSSSK